LFGKSFLNHLLQQNRMGCRGAL